MMANRLWMVAAIVALPVLSLQGAEPATGPDAGPQVPEADIKGIQKQFELPRDADLKDALKLLPERMERIIRLGEALERNCPDASNLHVVRSMMLEAADFLARSSNTESARKRRLEISRRIMASDAPPRQKLQADVFVTRARILEGKLSVKETDKEISGFAARYEKTAAAAGGVLYAALLADETRRVELREGLVDTLESKHLEAPSIRYYLRNRFGRHPDVGRPFRADLTLLDGTKLSLPSDTLGKVVVVHFWAVWHGPSAGEITTARDLYAGFADRGLVVVGVSLDTDREKLTDFIRSHRLEWKHAFTGLAGNDPTAMRYGVRPIPSVWVIGRDGKVVSDDAMSGGYGALRSIIAKALAAPATGPAGKS